MDEAPISEAQAKHLRFLRILVTTLTATMIVGLVTIVALLVIRFSAEQDVLQVPDSITLPDGAVATAFTQGSDWYAIVTADNVILIYDRKTGMLLQQVDVKSE